MPTCERPTWRIFPRSRYSLIAERLSPSHGRLYQLVREPDAVRERTLEITFLEAGAAAYVFTFG
jgi:hypothetical protein